MASEELSPELMARLQEQGIDWESFQAMLASVAASTGEAFPRHARGPVPKNSAPVNFSPNPPGLKLRPNTQIIQMLQQNPDELDDLCPVNSADETTCFVRSNVFKSLAEHQWAAKNYSEARSTYIRAASEMVATSLPSSGDVRSDVYTALAEGWHAIDLIGCINGIVECSRQLKDYDCALLWLGEAEVLQKNLDNTSRLRSSSFEWTPIQVSSADYYFERLSTLCLASAVFLSLGNTGSAVHRRWLADEIFAVLPASLKTPQTVQLTPLLGSDILALRHPDPQTAPTLTIEHPALQLCGSWQKLSILKPGTLASRMRSAIFAFDGHFYLLGGEKSLEGPWYRDFWTLDLAKLDGWRQLPDFPLPNEITGDLVGFHMVPHRDGRAFVFTGTLSLAVFDTKRRKWSTMLTEFVPDAQTSEWPYPSQRLIEYSALCVGDRVYVFGGLEQRSVIGTDLLMELHVPSRKWRRLSGTSEPVPSVSSPGPRAQCHSWVGKDGSRIFFMFGEADRQAAMSQEAVHGGFYSYAYGDLWSWDIRAAKWTQERLLGNVPSPRSEMACVYSQALDKVVVFGGYSPAVPTWFDDMQNAVTYSYYADTFIADMGSGARGASRVPIAWKQVLTRGFPTYRAQATLITDAKSGKIFLFGGYKNTTYVKSKNKAGNNSVRSFMDLWQLRLDMPGGFFEGVDLEEEARTAQAGPWQRCFTCSSTGPWKRCGGTCKGRVFFCDSECLKEGWREHKDKHGCKKA
ncbi:hypothetical protein C8R44DRAFT_55384 [Mycena epipterygia]|nr:hypothetical protein C8R44DRAFT_55384 [Mycena epipterygia]